MNNVYKILHITPHLGGGVGRVVLNYLSSVKHNDDFVHTVACLDYANETAHEVAQKIGLPLVDSASGKKQELYRMIADADIVLIHWWNHPLLYDFLVRSELPSCRVVMWSHISGFHPPYVFTEKIFNYSDLFVFTTPVSFDTKEATALSEKQRNKLRVIWSTGGVEHVKNVKPKNHKGFTIGYIGTVDYCKIHPDFFTICSKIEIPDGHFIVCGGPKEHAFRMAAEQLGMGSRFNFTGLIKDITDYLSIFDVFGYPLAPYHYGTCDQALAESMAAGIVPVVFSNRMESLMVKNNSTGLVVDNMQQYATAIKNLHDTTSLKDSLAENAKKYALQTFSLETLRHEWEKIFSELLSLPKTSKKWNITKQSSEISAKDVFLEALGDHGDVFVKYCNAKDRFEKLTSVNKIKNLAQSAIWQADTRGTVHHYCNFFTDPYLSEWSSIMKGVNHEIS